MTVRGTSLIRSGRPLAFELVRRDDPGVDFRLDKQGPGLAGVWLGLIPAATAGVGLLLQLTLMYACAIVLLGGEATERRRLPIDSFVRPQQPLPDRELVLTVVGGQREVGAGLSRPVMVGDVRTNLAEVGETLRRAARELARPNAQRGSPLVHVMVVVRSGKDVPAGELQQVIREAQEVGFGRFSLRDVPQEQLP